MLRVMLIDDEPSALKVMEVLFRDFENIYIAGMYTSGEKALVAISKDKPDAIFADIEMPGINGLDIAGEVVDKYPGIDIVFVTAYNQYAVSAFEMSAIDYLLKPVRKERLDKTVIRLEKNKRRENRINPEREPELIRIQCFRKFAVYASPGIPVNWRTKKTEELMALFVHNRHRELSREAIIEILWPETEMKKANTLFHTTMYNLKKALKQLDGKAALKKVNGGYRLYLDDIACDVDDLEKIIIPSEQINDDNIKKLEEALKIYSGAYYEEDGYLWSENKRFELESKLIASCLEMSGYYQKKVLWEKTVGVLRSILKIDFMNQAAFERLVLVYSKLGNTGLMLQTYGQYKSMMEELRIQPKTLEELNKN